MSQVKRVYVEKKAPYAVKARELSEEISSYLGIDTVTDVRVLVRYDVENITEETYRQALVTVFAELPVDSYYEETFPRRENDRVFGVEYLPGQFDQRADSAIQCVRFLKEDEQPVIRTATVYVIGGEITDQQFAAIKSFCINPVDSRETGMEKPDTLVTVFEEPADVKIFDGFCGMKEEALTALYRSLNLAMSEKDFKHIQNYFAGEEHRDPTMTEIRLVDTYWSDHCRHTTFGTHLKQVEIQDPAVKAAYETYLAARREVYGEKAETRPQTLMDIATLGTKVLKKRGFLKNVDILNKRIDLNPIKGMIPHDDH